MTVFWERMACFSPSLAVASQQSACVFVRPRTVFGDFVSVARSAWTNELEKKASSSSGGAAFPKISGQFFVLAE